MRQSEKDTLHKIGIFGGSFNPIHNGHLLIAENAREQFGLERVLFLPNGNPPHKDAREMVSSSYRCEMIEKAIEGNPAFSLCRYEVDRTQVSYSWETLAFFCRENPDTLFYFIMGEDSLYQFGSWRHPERIADSCVILTAVREQEAYGSLSAQIEKVKLEYQADVRMIPVPEFNVSSRLIRERNAAGRTIRYLTPEPVREFIREHHLYE